MQDPDPPCPPTDESLRIKAEIARFLREQRLQPKLEKLKDASPDSRQDLIDKHEPLTWVADAAKRVIQIRQATHISKFTHPSAGDSNLSSNGNPQSDRHDLGTHVLAKELLVDVTGNAAALDVYQFLCLTIDGRSVQERAVSDDPALIRALGDDEAVAREWVKAFAGFAENTGTPRSHKLAKQVYWPVAQDGYHLLAPLLSSPLAHAVHDRITEDRFSDAAKAAREAQRAGKPHVRGYRDYPDLAIQNFGGSKPQNISQLNSKRRGENYLLASVPPNWKSADIRPPHHTESVFLRHFGRRPETRRLALALHSFLQKVADRRSNLRIRDTRAELVAGLCDEALNMAAELHQSMPAGWTAQPECRLKLSEQCWLDPGRAASDSVFANHYRRGEWKDDVCLGFANWLNATLHSDRTLLGGAEAQMWQSVLAHELDLLREDLGDE